MNDFQLLGMATVSGPDEPGFKESGVKETEILKFKYTTQWLL